jgi:AcrR family transcriptional regulator
MRLKTEIRKQQFVDAARKLIIKKGSEHLTIREMAETVGLTEGALYRHFRSKSDVLRFVLEDIEQRLLKYIDTKQDPDSALSTLRNIMARHLSLEERKRGSFQVIAEIISLGDKALNKKAIDTINQYNEGIKKIIDRGKASGEISQEVSAPSAAILFFSIIQGLTNIWALSNYKLDLQEHCEFTWQLFHDSLVVKTN